MNKYECRARYEKTGEDGVMTKVTDIFIVEAVSISDAETRLIENIAPFITGEFEIISIKKVSISEIVTNEADYWFKAKVYYISINETTGKEKKAPHTFLVQADAIDEAIDNINEFMKGTISDWELGAFTDTNIVDVFLCGNQHSKSETDESSHSEEPLNPSEETD